MRYAVFFLFAIFVLERVSPRALGRGGFLYAENHSLGEWFKRRLVPIMQTIKTPFATIEVRSANCTTKQREVIQNERRK